MKLKKIAGFIVLANVSWCGQVHAGLAELNFTTEVERQSALVTLQSYNELIADAGCSDDMTGPGARNPTGQPGTAAVCNGATYQLFTKLRALVQTAREISRDNASTQYSLGLSEQQLSAALRWTAPEEYSAQGSLSRDFMKGQIAGLSSRLTALRLGATGFSGVNNQSIALNETRPMGGGASADQKDNTDAYSRLGGFINFSLGDGSKSASNLEDAFNTDGKRINAGFDFRVNQNWVIGAMLGYGDQTVNFDRKKSIAEGKIQSSGYSLMPFALFQSEQFYASASVGSQKLQFDAVRVIRYPSTDTETKSKSDSQISSYALEAGYSFQKQQFTFEPFVNVNSATTNIDKFVETDRDNSALNLAVDGQKLKSNVLGLGVNLRYRFTPSFGVVTPFASIEQLKQTDTGKHIIASHYVNTVNSTNEFALPGDNPDSSYRVVTLGVSSVLRGGREQIMGGTVAGGLQGFLHYKIIQGLQDYKMHTIEFGFRYEF